MPTNRTFILACATVATLALSAASSTPADARPCRTADSTPRQEGSCLVRSAISAVMTEATKQQAAAMKAAMAKQAAAMKAAMTKQAAAKQAEMEKQMQAAMAAKQAEMEKQMQAAMAAKQAEMEKQLEADMAKQDAAKQVATTSAAPVRAKPCLTKEYFNGAVTFRDNCTGEWAQRSD
jgi:hypothetical protein